MYTKTEPSFSRELYCVSVTFQFVQLTMEICIHNIRKQIYGEEYK